MYYVIAMIVELLSNRRPSIYVSMHVCTVAGTWNKDTYSWIVVIGCSSLWSVIINLLPVVVHTVTDGKLSNIST